MVAANLTFSCCTFALKLIPADMFDIMIVRFFIQSTVFGSYAAFYKRYGLFDTNGQPVASALNVLMSSGTNLTFLAAFYVLPLSDLNTIKYTYIVWAAILSVVFLKDRFKLVNSLALILTIIGLILATRSDFLIEKLNAQYNQTLELPSITARMLTVPTTEPCYYLGIGFAALSSLTKAIQMIARKQLVQKKQPYSIMNFQFTSFALVVSVSYSLIRRLWQPEPYPWRWMCTAGVAIGCCQLLTNTFYAKALKRENVQFLSIIGTLDILYAVVLQYIFFRQSKSWIFFLGASLIVLSAIILWQDTYRASQRQKKKEAIDDDETQTNHV